MKILFVEKQLVTGLAALMTEAGHSVTSIKDEKAAAAALAPKNFQLAVFSVGQSDDAAIAAIRTLRGNQDLKQLHVVLLSQEGKDDYLVRAYDAGADSVLRRPLGLPVIMGQLRAVQRSISSLDSTSGGDADPQATPLDRVSHSKAWRGARQRLGEVAAKFLTMEIALSEAGAVSEPIEQACTIALSNAEHQLEMRIALGTGAASGRRLAVHLFGPEGNDLVPDMLSELANIMMGNLKASLSAESFAFTVGLPAPLDKAELIKAPVNYTHQTVFAMQMAEASVLVHLSVRSKANLFVPPGRLHEGMVLAKDVFNARGLLVVQSGTRLSLNMIEKIATIVSPKALVEVVAP